MVGSERHIDDVDLHTTGEQVIESGGNVAQRLKRILRREHFDRIEADFGSDPNWGGRSRTGDDPADMRSMTVVILGRPLTRLRCGAIGTAVGRTKARLPGNGIIDVDMGEVESAIEHPHRDASS